MGCSSVEHKNNVTGPVYVAERGVVAAHQIRIKRRIGLATSLT